MTSRQHRDLSGFGSVLAMAVLLLSCATSGSHRQDRPSVALRRGSTWTTYSFALPRIIGPSAELQLKDGVLRGIMASRTLNVTIRPEQATGSGSSGPVNVKIVERDGRVEVDGLWNGAPAHLVVSSMLVRGSVVVSRARTGAGEVSCGYQLDRLQANGTLVGSSACVGMPEETRLDVDPAVRQQLKPHELAVFLLAALSAPPMSSQAWR